MSYALLCLFIVEAFVHGKSTDSFAVAEMATYFDSSNEPKNRKNATGKLNWLLAGYAN